MIVFSRFFLPNLNAGGHGFPNGRWISIVTHFFTFLLALLLPLVSLVTLAAAQDGALVLDPSADYTFGEDLRFSLQAQNAATVQELTLVFRPELSPNIYEVDVPFQPGQTISVTQSIDVNDLDLRPFSDVAYSWEYKTAGGSQKIPEQFITYADDRFAWQKMTRDAATAHWVGEPPPFGQSVLDIVDNSLLQLDEIVPLEKIDPLDIYVYPNMVELREALPQNGLEKFQTSQLDLGVILVATASAQLAETELPQSIPYELAHLLLYRAAGEQYATLPWWLLEGIAAAARPDNNPHHDQVLSEAVQSRGTIPLVDLCSEPQGSGARQDLASLQSASFIRFLVDRQSTGTIPDLLAVYINGIECEQGVEQVLDTSLDVLEQEWLDSMRDQAPWERFFNDAAIWIGMLTAGSLLTIFLIYAARQKGKP